VGRRQEWGTTIAGHSRCCRSFLRFVCGHQTFFGNRVLTLPLAGSLHLGRQQSARSRIKTTAKAKNLTRRRARNAARFSSRLQSRLVSDSEHQSHGGLTRRAWKRQNRQPDCEPLPNGYFQVCAKRILNIPTIIMAFIKGSFEGQTTVTDDPDCFPRPPTPNNNKQKHVIALVADEHGHHFRYLRPVASKHPRAPL